jgi:prepilin-type N-terminal cleavage/methylation domain-containing protein
MINKRGFTLIEILLVVAAIAILAGIVIIAINPAKQLGETRNAQRRSDVLTIANSVNQYYIDNEAWPGTIDTGGTCGDETVQEVCKTGFTCSGKTTISNVTLNEKYIVSLPIDPTGSTSDGTGYYITKSTNDRITVCAPSAEQSETISISR